MTGSDPILLYVGTYTRRESFVDGKAEGIYIYRLDPASGALSYVATVAGAGTINPSFLAIAPDQGCLYAVNEIAGDKGPHGTVSAFAIDPDAKGLTFLNQQSTYGLAPCYVSVDPTGRYVLVANYETGSVCVLPLAPDGRLEEATDVVQFHGSGPNSGRQEGPHAHMIVPGPDGRFTFVVDLGTDRILAYRLDPARGKLVPAEPAWTQLAAGTGPRHLAFHPSSRFAYVISELQSTVTVLRYDEQHGSFEEQQTISTLPAEFTGQNLGAEIQVAPSGRFVYASNRGHNSIVIYAADHESGALSMVGHEPTQGLGPRSFTLDPAGNWLLVADQDSDRIVTFRVDQKSGRLTPTGHVAQVPTPVCLQLLRP
jgi:6-phosphogluconolactonase